MQIKELIAKVKDDWSSWLVIAAVLTAGTNFGQTMTQLNYQITDLSKTVAALSESVQEIGHLEDRIVELENKLSGHKDLTTELLTALAEDVILSNIAFEDLDKNTTAKMALKTACGMQNIKFQMYDDLGADPVIKYCNYVR